MSQSLFNFDEGELARYLETHVEGFQGPLTAEKFAGGQSNPTFLLQAEAVFGPVTVLVNNAGVVDSKRFVSVDESSCNFVMDTNLKAVWSLASAVTRRFGQRAQWQHSQYCLYSRLAGGFR